MNLYISDLHFGHRNVIRFDNRPFKDVDEMDACLIKNWNSKVSADDDVYVLGDFCYRAGKSPDWYLSQLVGRKHLIVGNHDGVIMKSEKALSYFESVDRMLNIKDSGHMVCLCHFPIADWDGARHGSLHVYGHIHGSRDEAYQFMKQKENAVNAAACINYYTPASLEDLFKNNKVFQESEAEVLTSSHFF